MPRALYTFFHYWFYPNPGFATYAKPTMIGLMAISVALILASFAIRFWRRSLENARTKKLSRSWASTLLWFGVIGLLMVISRVETIQFLAMRALWPVWILSLLGYGFYQLRTFRQKNIEIIKQDPVYDPREKYLPKAKK